MGGAAPGLLEKVESRKPAFVSQEHYRPLVEIQGTFLAPESLGSRAATLCSAVFGVANNYYPVLITSMEELQAAIFLE